MVRYDIRFTGQVQGVFFRATAQRVAAGFAVTGWVRNEPDGSVRCVIEGESGELERFVAAVERAKRGNIAGREIRKAPATGEFEGFEIRR
jgi:acylphosphatase